jgi:hypothetical protein
MTYRVRIDFAEGDTLWVASVAQRAYLTPDKSEARRCNIEINARQYAREWEATLALLGLEGRVFWEPYDLEYPVSPRLSPDGREYLCDICGRRWDKPYGASTCAPCRRACNADV